MTSAAASPLSSLYALSKRQVDLLSSPLVSSLFDNHPNNVVEIFKHIEVNSGIEIQTNDVPSAWSTWWKWSSEGPERWIRVAADNILLHSDRRALSPQAFELAESTNSICPQVVLDALRTMKCNSIPRNADCVTLKVERGSFTSELDTPTPIEENIFLAKNTVGMSPKKIHEVSRMVAYIRQFLESLNRDHGISISHIVDIGAGQGYLSNALRDMRFADHARDKVHVLALDSVDEHTSTAQRRQKRAEKSRRVNAGSRGSLTHRTLQLGYDLRNDRDRTGASFDEDGPKQALEVVINEWLQTLAVSYQEDASVTCTCTGSRNGSNSKDGPTPILFVALHACGSLTPTILRQVVSFRSATSERSWYCGASVVVGCCYNLLERSDFPLSTGVKAHASSSTSPSLELSINHLQLAAQVPLQWLRSEESLVEFKLALRKMTYRALLSVFLKYEDSKESQATNDMCQRRRIGKLHDSAYSDFDTFLDVVGKKLSFDFTKRRRLFPDLEHSQLARQLEVLHVLRCVFGPAVESLIIVDRLCWLLEVAGDDLQAELVNIFNQGTSSGRNLAIITRPR